MARDYHHMRCFIVFLATLICNLLPCTAAFSALSRNNEVVGIQNSQRSFSTNTESSLNSSPGRCQEVKAMIAKRDAEKFGFSQRQERKQATDSTIDRRSALFHASLVAALPIFLSPSPASALKEKNEALCGTGFFEHIYEYKCTSIGDIEDEGASKAMNQAQSDATDSLMGKLGFDTGDIVDSYDAKKKPTNKDSGKSDGTKK